MKVLYVRNFITMLLIVGLLIGSIVFLTAPQQQPILEAGSHQLPEIFVSQVEQALVPISDLLTS